MLSRLRERKVVQWVVAYVVAAWALVEVMDLVGGVFDWSDTALRIAIILAVAGAPIVAVLGWYHGEKGRQRVGRNEAVLLGILGAFGLVAVVAFGGEAPIETAGAESNARGTSLDSLRYVILPIEIEPDVTADLRADLLLHDALGRWTGIEVVDLFQVHDAVVSRPAHAERTPVTRDYSEVARKLGAGRFVRGRLRTAGQGLRLDVALYRTENGELIRDAAEVLDPATPGIHDQTFARLSAHLLFGDLVAVDSSSFLTDETRSYPAREAFLAGLSALREWDLERADSSFGVATQMDPGYARAYLWRGQVQNWNGRHPSELLHLARRAAEAASRFNEREHLLATGLLALAQAEYQDACATYRELLQSSAADFAGWYGLGQCQVWDRAVLPDSMSPSGWRFRASYHSGLEAYRRGFDLLPSVHHGFRMSGLGRLRDLFLLGTSDAVAGRAVPPASGIFLARPAWEGDTLSLVPYLLDATGNSTQDRRGIAHSEAVDHLRRSVHMLTRRWAEAFPESADAQAALAFSLELLGDPGAIEVLERAYELAIAEEQRVSIAARRVWLLVKFGAPDDTVRLSRAAAIADSALGRAAELSLISEAEPVIIAAALTGRVHIAAKLAREAAEPMAWHGQIPIVVTAPAAALLAYAALGGPSDSIANYAAAVTSAIRNRVPASARSSARLAFMDRPASLALDGSLNFRWPALTDGTTYPVLEAQLAALRGDARSALAILEGREAARTDLRPSELAFDGLYPEARVRALLGDTIGAAALLGASLRELRWAEPQMVDDVGRAGALVRCMAFYAELSAALGRDADASRWAKAILILWAHADPALRPVVARMHLLTEGRIRDVAP